MKRRTKNDFFFLKAGPCWCSSCRSKQDRDKGSYEPSPDGLRQMWVCDKCKENRRLRNENNKTIMG